MAERLGVSEAAELLNETLQEEEEADKKLTEVAESLYEEVEAGDEAPDEEKSRDAAPPPRGEGGARRISAGGSRPNMFAVKSLPHEVL